MRLKAALYKLLFSHSEIEMNLPRKVEDRWRQKEVPAPAMKQETVPEAPGALCKQAMDSRICQRPKNHIGVHAEDNFVWRN
jgi:hypothetical protein